MSNATPGAAVSRIPLGSFAEQCRKHLQPITDRVSFFSAVSLDQDQTRQYLREPVEALPRLLLERLPPLRLILAPFLEKGSAGGSDLVSFERPQNQRMQMRGVCQLGEALFLFLPAEHQQVADYHYWLFNGVAALAVPRVQRIELSRFTGLIVDELNRNTRGDVDERSFALKQKLVRRQRMPGKETKLMREYVAQALEDTLTLYLHGLCCDIDVDPGPRQLASRYLRRRLEMLEEIFPPNPGYSVFPAGPRKGEETPAAR